MQPIELFQFCPRCGRPRTAENRGRTPFECRECGLVLHFNPTVAAAAFVFDTAGRVLLIRRAKDPAAGLLGVPGGFIDIGEAAEQGLCREVREEVGLELEDVRFLQSFPNVYPYREVTYPVVDLYFTAMAIDPAKARPLDAVAGLEWRFPVDIREDEIAFSSMRQALALLRQVRM